MKARSVLTILATACLALAACSTGATTSPEVSEPAASSGGAGTGVAVTLSEWSVANQPASIPAGSTTFTVTNDGPEDVHEFVVIKTDISMTELPADETGAVDETGGSMEIMGEIEDVAVGATKELTLDLEPGAYVLVCNIYDETEQESHYQLGMRSGMTVTQ
jgi:uncharacterized cupredoxin-like copper-binding protein